MVGDAGVVGGGPQLDLKMQKDELRQATELDRIDKADNARQLAQNSNFTCNDSSPEEYARAVKMGGGHAVQPGQTAYYIDPSARRRQIEAQLNDPERQKKVKGWA